jgi:septum formation protein
VILLNKLKDKVLVLASQSPRRQQLLSELGLPFIVRLNGNEDETYPEDLPYFEIPVYLAKKKADAFAKSLSDNEILITSDTIVYCNTKVLGKPSDREHAIEILKELSGRKHTVITGVSLLHKGIQHCFAVSTDVYFRNLLAEEIEYYVDQFKPFDKAGAYGIQEWIGYVGVERIDGSYFNVMGLPVQKLYAELCEFLDKNLL